MRKSLPVAPVQRFVIGQQVPVSHLGMTDGMKRLRLSGKERNMHAGVTNIQRLAVAEARAFVIRRSLTFAKRSHLASTDA